MDLIIFFIKRCCFIIFYRKTIELSFANYF
jgi:hypothetical protein